MESVKLNIPVMAIIDTNCNTDNITFPIPGNDDSTKSIKLFCKLISDAAISGMKEAMHKSGLDISKIDDEEIAQKKNSNTVNADLTKKVSNSEFKKSLEKSKKNNDESSIEQSASKSNNNKTE